MIAFSANKADRIPYTSDQTTRQATSVRNDAMTPLFMGAIEATINSLFRAGSMSGWKGQKVKLLHLMKQFGYLVSRQVPDWSRPVEILLPASA